MFELAAVAGVARSWPNEPSIDVACSIISGTTMEGTPINKHPIQ
jgi:hypothetical protein